MKKRLLSVLVLVLMATLIYAQADHKIDPKTLETDKIIVREILNPALQSAREQDHEPDWKALHTTITARYDANYADRNIVKAKIYFFYGRDWAQFSSAIVQYTQQYEWRDSLSLLDKNAKMILDHSDNSADLKAAQSWAKYAADKSPGNGAYHATYIALTSRLAGQ
jgi:hypothetical protein